MRHIACIFRRLSLYLTVALFRFVAGVLALFTPDTGTGLTRTLPGQIDLQAERDLLKFSSDWQLRLRCSPFYDFRASLKFGRIRGDFFLS